MGTVIFVLLALAGTSSSSPGLQWGTLRTWQAYLVNFLFWTGLAFGQICLLAVLNITGARWGRPLKRLAEAFGAFLPVGFLLFWILYLGKEHLFPWIRSPLPEKEAWLNVPFLFARDGTGILLLCLISMAMIYFSVRGDFRNCGDASAYRVRTHGGRLGQELAPAEEPLPTRRHCLRLRLDPHRIRSRHVS